MGILYLVSTPIGNLEDITIRAIKILRNTKYIACEDTRRAGFLLSEIEKRYPNLSLNSAARIPPDEQAGINHVFIRFDDHTEFSKLPELIHILELGDDIALISDAGTPLVADPGYKLVNECTNRKINVISIPGASAVLTALTSSGLPTNRFTFLGYPPEKKSHTLKLLSNIHASTKLLPSVYIFYCSPIKFNRLLNNLNSEFGDITVTVARELTKIHEESWTGIISAAISHFGNPKGEFVLLFSL